MENKEFPSLAHESWKGIINPIIPSMFPVIKKELVKKPFYPTPVNGKQRVFKAFSLPLNRVRVVILGQSPYPNANSVGYAFSIPDRERPYDKWPPSLKVIASSVCNDPDKYFDPTLSMWYHQGFLLLNTCLTMPVGGKGLEHRRIWYPFTSYIVKKLAEHDERIIFYAFGSLAKSLRKFAESNVFLSSVHPAALSHNPNMEFDSQFDKLRQAYYENWNYTVDLSLPF